MGKKDHVYEAYIVLYTTQQQQHRVYNNIHKLVVLYVDMWEKLFLMLSFRLAWCFSDSSFMYIWRERVAVSVGTYVWRKFVFFYVKFRSLAGKSACGACSRSSINGSSPNNITTPTCKAYGELFNNFLFVQCLVTFIDISMVHCVWNVHIA
jgi:hypothetical protein